MNYLPVAGWFFYGGGAQTTAKRAARTASWGLLDVAPEYAPPVLEYYSIPTHPIIPTIPTMARGGFLWMWILMMLAKLLGELK